MHARRQRWTSSWTAASTRSRACCRLDWRRCRALRCASRCQASPDTLGTAACMLACKQALQHLADWQARVRRAASCVPPSALPPGHHSTAEHGARARADAGDAYAPEAGLAAKPCSHQCCMPAPAPPPAQHSAAQHREHVHALLQAWCSRPRSWRGCRRRPRPSPCGAAAAAAGGACWLHTLSPTAFKRWQVPLPP